MPKVIYQMECPHCDTFYDSDIDLIDQAELVKDLIGDAFLCPECGSIANIANLIFYCNDAELINMLTGDIL